MHSIGYLVQAKFQTRGDVISSSGMHSGNHLHRPLGIHQRKDPALRHCYSSSSSPFLLMHLPNCDGPVLHPTMMFSHRKLEKFCALPLPTATFTISSLTYPPSPVIQSPLLWVEPNPRLPTESSDPAELYRPLIQHKVPHQKERTLWPCTQRECRAVFAKQTSLEQVRSLNWQSDEGKLIGDPS